MFFGFAGCLCGEWIVWPVVSFVFSTQFFFHIVISGLPEAVWIKGVRALKSSNYVLGNERFKEEIANMLKRRVTPGKAGRPAKESVN